MLQKIKGDQSQKYMSKGLRKILAVQGPSEHWIAFRNDPLSGKTGLQWPPAAHWC